MKLWLTLFFILVTAANVAAQSKYETDFAQFWNILETNYAYREESGVDFARARQIYLPEATKVSSNVEFIRLLESALNEFHNGHLTLNTNLRDSNRIIPSGTDIFAEFVDGVAIIRDVKPNSRAERAGLRAGMRVTKFNDEQVAAQLPRFLPRSTKSITPAMKEYAINMLFAGRRDQKRRFYVTAPDGKESEILPDELGDMEPPRGLLEFKVLPGNIGFIKINNSLFNQNLIAEFDGALDKLAGTNALILDLTDTPNGGNTLVARALMGRFTDREMPYQKHENPAEFRLFGVRRSWLEVVSPRGKIYGKPLVVAVGHWTGSMGEGIAVGFDGMKRAEIVGTRMAGLLGAISDFKLPATGVGFAVPTEKLFHIDGRPRESFVPRFVADNSTQTLNLAIKRAGGKR